MEQKHTLSVLRSEEKLSSKIHPSTTMATTAMTCPSLYIDFDLAISQNPAIVETFICVRKVGTLGFDLFNMIEAWLLFIELGIRFIFVDRVIQISLEEENLTVLNGGLKLKRAVQVIVVKLTAEGNGGRHSC
jgi:hypothetical protein